MKMREMTVKPRTICYIIAFTIFVIQAHQSLKKYFHFPVVYHEHIISINAIEKPTVQVCFKGYFDYGKAIEFGYEWKTTFLTGMMPNSTRPSWKGIAKNLSFHKIQQDICESNFSKVEVNKPTEFNYIFGKGFCLQTSSFGKKLQITSKEKNLYIFLSHSSTDTKIIAEQSMYSRIELGSSSDSTFDMKDYELSYEIQDNTIYDGKTCIDYRKQQETYGDCNYRVLKSQLFASYGCYPPWIESTEGGQCEIDIPSKELEQKLIDYLWNDIWNLLSGIKIDLMKQCMEPCYQVNVKWEEKGYTSWNKYAVLSIFDNVESVRIRQAVYSFDIFTLAVELGSAIGLWLGES